MEEEKRMAGDYEIIQSFHIVYQNIILKQLSFLAILRRLFFSNCKIRYLF